MQFDIHMRARRRFLTIFSKQAIELGYKFDQHRQTMRKRPLKEKMFTAHSYIVANNQRITFIEAINLFL